MNQLKKAQGIAYASCGLFSASQALLFVMYPVLAESMGLSLARVVACFSIGSFLFLWGGPYWSMRSDHEGRTRILRITQLAVLTSLAALAFLLSPLSLTAGLSFGILLLSRLLYGAVGSGLVPVSQALVLDLSDPTERTRSAATHSLFLNMGRLLGPIVGLLLATIAPLIIVLVFIALFALMMTVSRLPDTASGRSPGRKPFRVQEVWPETRELQALFVLAFLTTVFLGILQSSLGAFLQGRFQMSSTSASHLMARLLIAGACTTVLVQFLMRSKLKDPWQGSLPMGALGLLLGMILLLLSPSPLLLYGAVVFMSIGIALLTPSYTSAMSLYSGNEQGKSAGSLSVAHTLGYALGGGMSALGLSLSMQTPFIFALMVSLGIFATLRPVYRGRDLIQVH